MMIKIWIREIMISKLNYTGNGSKQLAAVTKRKKNDKVHKAIAHRFATRHTNLYTEPRAPLSALKRL